MRVSAGENGYVVCRYHHDGAYLLIGANTGAGRKLKPYRWYRYDGATKKWVDLGAVEDALLPVALRVGVL